MRRCYLGDAQREHDIERVITFGYGRPHRQNEG
jgi:hypothetical protein